MATIEELEHNQTWLRHKPDLEDWELQERCLLLSKCWQTWQTNKLKPASRIRGRDLSPFEQVEQLFYEYVVGKPLVYGVHRRKLEPVGLHIWELKTEDVRIFGWFIMQRHFVAVCGEFKAKLSKEVLNKSTNKLYQPYIENVRDYRSNIPLDEPKLTTAVAYNDVL
jgi:hypothetical protein